MSASITIGQSLTSKMITDAVAEVYTDLTIQGADVSVDGQTYTFSATPDNDAVFIFNLDNISVIEVTK